MDQQLLKRRLLWAAAAHITGAVVLGVISSGLDESPVDLLGTVLVMAIIASPAPLALLAISGGSQPLLVAGLASVGIAIVGLSLHSVLLLPVGVAYLTLSSRMDDRGVRRPWVLLLSPILLVSAMLTATSLQIPQELPCTIEYSSSSHPGEESRASRTCRSDSVTLTEALVSMALTAVGLLAASTQSRRKADAQDSPNRA